MKYFAYTVLALVLLVVIRIVQVRCKYKRLKAQSEAALGRIYSSLLAVPTIELSSSYGYPVFKVVFPSKLTMETAEAAGLNQQFRQEIDLLCKGEGPKARPFTAEMGGPLHSSRFIH